MPQVQPLFLPRPVIDENRLVLANDFGVTPRQFCFGPDGRLHVLSSLFYNYYRYDNSDNRDFSTYLVNVYGPDLCPEGIVDFSAFHQSVEEGKYPAYFNSDLHHPYLAVTPGNLVVLTTEANRTFFFDARLEKRLGELAAPDAESVQRVYDQGFAYQIEPSEDGRLLCVVSEPGVRFHSFSPNLICLSDHTPLSPGQRPELTCIACLKPELDENATFPYIRLPGGGNVGKGNRPVPALPEQAKERFDLLLWNPWLGQALPLDGDRCLVSLFHRLLRGGSKGLPFVFALLSNEGRIVGRLEGIDRHAESPYVEHHYRLAIDRAHRRIIYKNKTSFFLFDFDGKRLARVKLEGKPLSGLSALKLGCCSADGRIVLHHPKQHYLLALDPVAKPAELASVLADGAACVSKERSRLKKQYEWVHSRWVHPGPVVRH